MGPNLRAASLYRWGGMQSRARRGGPREGAPGVSRPAAARVIGSRYILWSRTPAMSRDDELQITRKQKNETSSVWPRSG
jgi:hypothetical protein